MIRGKYYVLLFFIQPFLSVIAAYRSKNHNIFRNALWAFSAFYGLTVAIGSESQGSDINRYVAEIQILYANQNPSLSSWWGYYLESGEIDIVRTIIALLVSSFTDDYNILLLIYGSIFGFFYASNVALAFSLVNRKSWLTFILFLCFALVTPLWSMGGFRFNTAVHVFLYGLLPLLITGKTSKLKWCFISVLFHYSFIVPIAVLLLYLFIKHKPKLIFGFFLISFFLPAFKPTSIANNVQTYLGARVYDRADSYFDEEKVSDYRSVTRSLLQSKRNWYADFYRPALRFSLLGFLIILMLSGQYRFQTKAIIFFISAAMLLYGITNLINDIPAGARFYSLADLVSLMALLVIIQGGVSPAINRYLKLIMPALVLFIIVSIRSGLLLTSLQTIAGNPVLSLLVRNENIELNDIMRSLLPF